MGGALARMLGHSGAAAASWQSVISATLSGDNNGWNNFTLRETIAPADLVDLTGSQIRLTLRAGNAEGLTVTKARIGLESGATNSNQYGAAPTVITFAGGSTSAVILAGASVVSDAITFSYTGTAGIVIALYFNGGGSSDMIRTGSIGTNAGIARWKAGDEVDTVGALSGYTSLGAYGSISNLEVFA